MSEHLSVQVIAFLEDNSIFDVREYIKQTLEPNDRGFDVVALSFVDWKRWGREMAEEDIEKLTLPDGVVAVARHDGEMKKAFLPNLSNETYELYLKALEEQDIQVEDYDYYAGDGILYVDIMQDARISNFMEQVEKVFEIMGLEVKLKDEYKPGAWVSYHLSQKETPLKFRTKKREKIKL